MAQDHSAVLLGAADTQIADGEGAHDMVHDRGDQGREAMREATQAIKATSLNLESSTMQRTLSSSHDLELHHTRLQDSSHDVFATENQDEPCVTTTAHDTTKQLVGTLNGIHEPNKVAPSSPSIVRRTSLPRDTTPPATPPPATTKTIIKLSPSAAASQNIPHEPLSNTVSSLPKPLDGAGTTSIPHEGNMIFGYQAVGAGSTSHRRRQYANTSALTDYEADLTGKDRAKQKEAVKRILMEKIKDDWRWEWPRPELKPQADAVLEIEPVPTPVMPVDTHESQGSIVEEQWKERDEWISNASDSGEETVTVAAKGAEKIGNHTKENPFRFESPDGVGETIKKTQSERKRRRKKRLAEEMAWNDGVRCFIERRDAWTGARRVSRSSSAKAGLSPNSKLRKSTSKSSEDEGSSTAIDPESSDIDEEDWEADIEIPIAPPLIPPTNAMRASINPTAYNTIYDKVIMQQLTPSCPINLKDITRSCVQGWKRDGEWPPKSSVPDGLAGKRRRKLSMASLFGLEKTKSKEEREKAEKDKAEREVVERSSGDHKPGAFKRSIQKLLLLGKDKDKEHGKEHHGNVSNGSNGKAKDAEAAAQA